MMHELSVLTPECCEHRRRREGGLAAVRMYRDGPKVAELVGGVASSGALITGAD